MLSIEQRQDVLDVLRARHPDGRFSLEDAVREAGSPVIVGFEPTPSEDEVRGMLKAWEWRSIIRRAPPDGFRFRRTG